MAERMTKEEAELRAFLRASRAYERKLQDIDWYYEKFLPLLDEYKAGKLKLDGSKPVFELLEGGANEAE